MSAGVGLVPGVGPLVLLEAAGLVEDPAAAGPGAEQPPRRARRHASARVVAHARRPEERTPAVFASAQYTITLLSSGFLQ